MLCGAQNGNFLGIGIDLAVNSSILVDASQAPGILITNGEFTSFSESGTTPTIADSTQVGARCL
jgi:hypothetical protein